MLEADLRRDRGERALRRVLVERHPAAEEIARVEPAQEEVGVRDGGLRPAAAVAGRTRVGSGALRSDAQASRLEPRERAAAGADRVDVDERHQHGQALQLGLGRDGRPAVDHEAEIERRPAHVDAQQVAPAARPGECRTADRPADRPREQRLDRLAARASGARDAAVRLHHVERARDLELAELALERGEVPLDPRRDVRVQHRGGRPLVLAPLARDLVGERDRQVGELRPQQVAHLELVLGIDVRVDQADGNRFDTLVADSCEQRLEALSEPAASRPSRPSAAVRRPRRRHGAAPVAWACGSAARRAPCGRAGRSSTSRAARRS